MMYVDFDKIRAKYKNPCKGCKLACHGDKKCPKWRAYDFCCWRDVKLAKKEIMGYTVDALHYTRMKERSWKKYGR